MEFSFVNDSGTFLLMKPPVRMHGFNLVLRVTVARSYTRENIVTYFSRSKDSLQQKQYVGGVVSHSLLRC